jgi:predicted ABC-type ATPase
VTGGSYLSIPSTIYPRRFRCRSHRTRGVSFAFETTPRSAITFGQAALAKRAGFNVEMRYLALDANVLIVEEHDNSTLNDRELK